MSPPPLHGFVAGRRRRRPKPEQEVDCHRDLNAASLAQDEVGHGEHCVVAAYAGAIRFA
jgi:hypothetical protein